MLHHNESGELSLYTQNRFDDFIIDFTKLFFDIRYCSNENCSCQPEVRLERIINDNSEIEKFLKKWKLYNEIMICIKSVDKNKIVGLY
jgi:hypothetical protein